AKAVDDPSLTVTGGSMGTPGYMAPELFRGADPTPASDLWSLGVVLFFAVEGKPPFHRANAVATMYAVANEEPQLSTSDSPLAQVILGLLTKSSNQRLGADEV